MKVKKIKHKFKEFFFSKKKKEEFLKIDDHTLTIPTIHFDRGKHRSEK